MPIQNARHATALALVQAPKVIAYAAASHWTVLIEEVLGYIRVTVSRGPWQGSQQYAIAMINEDTYNLRRAFDQVVHELELRHPSSLSFPAPAEPSAALRGRA